METIISISQLDLPLISKYRLFKTGFLKELSLLVGIHLGLNLSAEEKWPQSLADLGLETPNLKKQYRTLDSGMIFGLEYQIGESFVLDLRYFFSALNLFKQAVVDEDKRAGLYETVHKNQVVQFGLAYRF